MRRALLAPLLCALVLAGCAGDAEPVPAPVVEERAPPWAGVHCDEGEVVTGFDRDGEPVCRDLVAVAMEAQSAAWAASPPPNAPAKSLSLTSRAALVDGMKSYTVAAATPGLGWEDLVITVDGRPYAQDASSSCEARTLATPASFRACGASGAKASGAKVDAGDSLSLWRVSSGSTLRVLDADANSVVLTLTVG